MNNKGSLHTGVTVMLKWYKLTAMGSKGRAQVALLWIRLVKKDFKEKIVF